MVEIRDTGEGIAPVHLSHIFEKFYQVDPSLTRTHGGAGLGLAISKAIVEAHGGMVGVESEVDVGSVFRFTLPISSAIPEHDGGKQEDQEADDCPGEDYLPPHDAGIIWRA